MDEKVINNLEKVTIEAIITKVAKLRPAKTTTFDTKNRIMITLNTKFKGFNDTNEEVETDTFGKNVYELVRQIGAQVPEIQVADALALGAPVSTKILSLALTNAKVTITRELRPEGTINEVTGKPYANAVWVTTVDTVTPNILPAFSAFLQNEIVNSPAEPQETQVATSAAALAAQLLNK